MLPNYKNIINVAATKREVFQQKNSELYFLKNP